MFSKRAAEARPVRMVLNSSSRALTAFFIFSPALFLIASISPPLRRSARGFPHLEVQVVADGHFPADLLAQLLQDLAHLQVRVLHEALLQEADLGQVLVELALGDALEHLLGLARAFGLLAEDPFLLRH